jgi:hypothetical protein
MKTPNVAQCVSVLAVVPMLLCAQPLRDAVPLRHWAAPLYWQPSKLEADALALRPEAETTPLPVTPLVFLGITPCRAVDTRADQGFSGADGPPSLIGGASRTFQIALRATQTSCPVSSRARAFSLNVTVVPLAAPVGFITVFPTGQSVPLAAALTSLQGQIVSNAAIVPAGTNGSIDVFTTDGTDIVIDVNGYYVSLNEVGNGQTLNTAVGLNALEFSDTGSANTAIGARALAVNNGSYNTATGSESLSFNTTGAENTATGAGALYQNTTGSDNTATGNSALAGNTTGVKGGVKVSHRGGAKGDH